MSNQSALLRAMLAREVTTIDPEFLRTAQSYSSRYGLKTGVFRDRRNMMYWEVCKPRRKYIWRSI